MLYQIIRPILFAVGRDDAEKSHDFALWAMKQVQRFPALLAAAQWYCQTHEGHATEVCGIHFPNRLGLAAGFDKGAEVLPFLQALGFGFVEIGTVTPRPQLGNPRPRLFRVPDNKGLINRFGFNSDGAEVVAERLAAVKPRICFPVGISVGRNKDTPNERAAEDCAYAIQYLYPYADYLVVNISSPNTEGLRDIQYGERIERFLHDIVRSITDVARSFNGIPKPLFLKISPDLSEGGMGHILDACTRAGIQGIIIGNTTTDRPLSRNKDILEEAGGYSGPDCFDRTMRNLRFVRERLPRFPLILVGGIDSLEKAERAFDGGATLIQILTGFVYGGPPLVRQLRIAG